MLSDTNRTRTEPGTHHSRVVNQLKVGLVFVLLVGPWALEVGGFPQVVVEQFGFQAVVRGLGEHALLLHDGQDSHWLHTQTAAVQCLHVDPPPPGDQQTHPLNEVDAGLQVQTEVYEGPLYPLSVVLLLLQDEHVVVEILLQLLVGEVDAQLFEAVELQEKET